MHSSISSFFLAAASLLLATQLRLSNAQDAVVGGKNGLRPIASKSLGTLMKQYEIAPKVFVREYNMKSELGNIVRRQANTTAAKSNLTTIDLTPADCEDTQCYPGAFDRPNMTDCDVVWAAQLYNSTGSLTAFPGTFVYVYSGTCAVVFQNPQNQGYALQFNWAKLGAVGVKIARRCLTPKVNAIGGICQYHKYLAWDLKDVLISVQKHVEGQNPR
ncbi:secreted protein [Melampsora americana]|nr:secreted protein [Melampsora americana]